MADLYPPKEDEAAFLPDHLRPVFSGWGAIGRDQNGAADIYGSSGKGFLDEHQITEPEERWLWLYYWRVIEDAVQHERAVQREVDEQSKSK